MDILFHIHLLLSTPIATFDKAVNDANGSELAANTYHQTTKLILEGQSANFVSNWGKEYNVQGLVSELEQLVLNQSAIEASQLQTAVQQKITGYLKENFVCNDVNSSLLLAIALLQTFIQANYTGPAPNLAFPKMSDRLKQTVLQLLSCSGQPAYELCDYPICLLLSLILVDLLTGDVPNNAESGVAIPIIDRSSLVPFQSICLWWKARAIMCRLSLLHEPAGDAPVVASSIYSSIDLVASILADQVKTLVSENTQRELYTIFYLENAKCSLAINTEHFCLPSLIKAQKLTNFQFVLTGARAKRTKYQSVAHANLVVLAKSDDSLIPTDTDDAKVGNHTDLPQSLDLNHEMLLEKPVFESIGAEPLDQQIYKKSKITDENGFNEDTLLPTALRQENIPILLRELDPNSQPKLNNLDDIQLLLRLYTLRQTSPAKDPLVEIELSALVTRLIFDGQDTDTKDWSIFSRSLWERSIIETTKAKTVERGLLQMQALVEELGLKIKTTSLPTDADAENSSSDNGMTRMKYIHQLPFLPRWNLDATLAEKYMSMGILRSAVEIYERLQMPCEAALCYAAVGDEKEAERILEQKIITNPTDCRAFSILGDIKQDPELWEKAWSLGKYVNAKNSLGKYYFNVKKDNVTALKHLNDSLKQYPLSFETWYFYGCVALEHGNMTVAAEAFSRCVSLEDDHALSWSNLSAAYVELGKLKQAHNCLQKAVKSDSQKNWRIWENYMMVSMKCNEWDDVLLCCQNLLKLKKDNNSMSIIDLPVIEKLVELLITSEYDPENQRLTHFQTSCIDFVCVQLPQVITNEPRCWKLVSKVELWRKRPWAALENVEKAYRSILHNPDLDVDEKVWNDTVDACEDLVAAYESLGEMEGRMGDLVCKDWKYKARSTIKSLMSKGKKTWDGSEGWERLLEMRNDM